MTALKNSEKAALNIMTRIANSGFSYFDEGINEGSGIWLEALAEEIGYSKALTTQAIKKLVKDGLIVKSGSKWDSADEDGFWVELTADGADRAQALLNNGVNEYFTITEDSTPAKSATRNTAKAADNKCHCGCGEATAKLYKPGHDAKHVSMIRAEIADCRNDEDYKDVLANAEKQLSPKLFAKLIRTQR